MNTENDKIRFAGDFSSAAFSYDMGTPLYYDYDGAGAGHFSVGVAKFENFSVGGIPLDYIEIDTEAP